MYLYSICRLDVRSRLSQQRRPHANRPCPGMSFLSTSQPLVDLQSQFFYLAMATCAFTLVNTYLALDSPSGPQPAAYGHLQTLADLIDYWPPRTGRIWWGDKTAYNSAIRHAGACSLSSQTVTLTVTYRRHESRRVASCHGRSALCRTEARAMSHHG